MKQSYEDAVLKTVMWWVEKSFNTTLNQNNGDNSPQGGMAFMLMNMLSMDSQKDATPDKIKKFEEKLTELLMENRDDRFNRNLDVDYHPCKLLSIACEYAGINPGCLPCKTFSQIDDQNRVYVKYQYGAPTIEI